ncbi:MAG: DMT family transporter [Alphaproteobacteria bacterium]|jgi:drug/metabolite transporter (DMT)-like permease
MNGVAPGRSDSEIGPYAMLLVAALILASNHIISRYLNGVLPPFGTAFWRFAIGGMVMLPLAGRSFWLQWPLIRRHFRFFVLLAVLFVPFSNGFIYLAYQWTTAMNGGVVSTVQPALTVALSALLFRDLVNRKQFAGLIIATVGVLVIVSRGDPVILLTLQFNVGDLALVFAMFSVALYNVLLRKVPAEINVPLLLLIVQIFGCAVTLPVYVAESVWYRTVPLTFEAIAALVWIGVAVTAIAVGLNNAAVRAMGANKASIGNYMRSIFTALLAIALLGESFETYHAVALALVIGGVWLLSRGRSIGR